MLEDLLEEISSSGWLLNNCYQIDSALWRVNLRRPSGNGDYFTDWAEGSDLAAALAECMSKLADAEWEEQRKSVAIKGVVVDVSSSGPSARTLLSRLGLARPKIERRI